MTLEDTIRDVVRTEVRDLRDELRRLLAERPNSDRYVSVANAAAHAEVHADTIRAWVKAGALPEHRAGRELRVKLSELEALLDGQRQHTARPSIEEEAAALPTRTQR